VHEADLWLAKLRPLQELVGDDSKPPVKVAILDTGLCCHTDDADRYYGRYESHCFLNDQDVPTLCDSDHDGHGTHMASIILEVAPHCKVYSARVCRQRTDVRDKESSEQVVSRIVSVSRRHTISTHTWNLADSQNEVLGNRVRCRALES
jgi:hypothetical protein